MLKYGGEKKGKKTHCAPLKWTGGGGIGIKATAANVASKPPVVF